MKRETRKGLMKKISLFLLIFTLIVISSTQIYGARIKGFSQLQYGENFSINASVVNVMTANTSRIYITNGGLVGIGTLAPDVELKVVGDVNVTGTVWSQGINLSSSSAGGWTDDGDTVRLSTTSDRVSIGAATSPQKLHVDGNTSVTGDLVVTGDVVGNAGAGSGASALGWIRMTSYVILSSITDWVGIGTNTPNSSLTVAGNITPSLNNTYSLGEVDLVWKDVYVGDNSLHIGGKTLSNDGGMLEWGGAGVGVSPGDNLNLTNLNVSGKLIVEDDVNITGELNVGTNITYNGNISYVRMVTGTYTGDGSSPRNIVGVGFRPKFVMCYGHVVNSAEVAFHADVDTTYSYTWHWAGSYSANQYEEGHISAMLADGFTVEAGCNTNSRVFTYIAWG